MNFWNALPLFRLIFPFILGILLSDYLYFKIKTTQISVEVDYCLISDYFPIDKLLQTYRPKRIVLDAALSYYEVQKLIKECLHLNVKCYSLKKDKALIVNLKN